MEASERGELIDVGELSVSYRTRLTEPARQKINSWGLDRGTLLDV